MCGAVVSQRLSSKLLDGAQSKQRKIKANRIVRVHFAQGSREQFNRLPVVLFSVEQPELPPTLPVCTSKGTINWLGAIWFQMPKSTPRRLGRTIHRRTCSAAWRRNRGLA